MTFYERIENQGTQTLAVWMFIELLARMCNVLRLGSEVCNWLPASYLKKKEYSLHSAFCTQPAFYSQSAVCILHSLCILPWSAFCSLQSAVCSLQSAVCVLHWPYENLLKEKREINSSIHTDGLGIKPKKSVRRKKRTLRWNVYRTIIYRLYINYLTFWPQNCSNVCGLKQVVCALRLQCIVDAKFSRWRRRSRNFGRYMLCFSIDIVLRSFFSIS